MSSKRKASDVEDEGETEEVVKVAKVESNGEKSEDEEKDAGENGVSAEAGASAPAANQKSEDKEVPAPSVAVAADIPDKDKGKVKGPDHAGTLLICGGTNWDLSGRKSLPKGGKNQGPNLWTPHRFKPMSGIRVRLVASGCVAAHSIIVTEEGRAFSFGRNEKGQLGVGDQVRRDNPTLIEAIKDEFIVGASCGRNHSLMLTDRGEVYAAGDNKMGQCGIKNASQASADVATAVNYKGAPIVKVDCGGDFSIILDCKGAMHSFGLPEYGQLGHNTDGKFFVTSTKMGFDYQTAPKRIVFFIERGKDGKIKPVEVDEIRDFSCGTNHTVAIDARKRAFSWGFGGLGRLGHAEQRDEMMPRLIKFFDSQNRGVKAVFCGNSYSLAINDFGVVFMFGQNKRTGEANMYPKPNQDLTGWNVRSVGCSTTSIVVAADESVIAWGPSPTSGELGFGEARKSSTVPMEVKPLDGMYIEQVTCGVSHTLFIARDITEEEKEKINALPEYAPA